MESRNVITEDLIDLVLIKVYNRSWTHFPLVATDEYSNTGTHRFTWCPKGTFSFYFIDLLLVVSESIFPGSNDSVSDNRTSALDLKY